MKYPTLLAAARDDISTFDLRDDLETGGGLFGYRELGRLVISHAVEATVERTETSVKYDTRALARLDRDGHRIIGHIHSHPTVTGPRARPSGHDLAAWKERAAGLKHEYLGVIIHPRRELPWRGGFPSGLDWSFPHLSTWVVTPDGTVRSTYLAVQPHWLAELEAQVRMNREQEELRVGYGIA